MKKLTYTIIGIGLLFGIIIGQMYSNNKLEYKVDHLESYIEILEQAEIQEEAQRASKVIEGKYTLITNLSSSIYMNSIPDNFEKIHPWTDANGVSGFDTIVGNMYLRYVEGHILMPQLALYAPNMHLEVVSDSEWPKEGN
jgi:hypothetical protein